jgi:hypothetical protein
LPTTEQGVRCVLTTATRVLAADPFAAVIFCSSNPRKVDGKMRSKWSRVFACGACHAPVQGGARSALAAMSLILHQRYPVTCLPSRHLQRYASPVRSIVRWLRVTAATRSRIRGCCRCTGALAHGMRRMRHATKIEPDLGAIALRPRPQDRRARTALDHGR